MGASAIEQIHLPNCLCASGIKPTKSKISKEDWAFKMVRTESPVTRERTVNRDRQEAKAHPEIPVRMESPEKTVRPEPLELPAEAEITVLLSLVDLQ